jgi:TolB protein
MRENLIGAVLLAAGLVGSAFASDIDILGSVGKSKIDLSGISAAGEGGSEFRKALENDLKRSGWFLIAAPGQGQFSVKGTAADAGGSVSAAISVQNREGRVLLGERYSGAEARRTAHKAADDILKALKGINGIASTRIVMIGSRGGKKDLYVCDADGGNFTRLTEDNAVCLAPSWHPGGQAVVYTSYFQGNPHVYSVDLARKTRRKVSGFPGLNAGASYSLDGSRIALALSKDGNPEIYTIGPDGGGLRRLTVTRTASEASPVWAPDGRSIAYVSDRSGAPQVYVRGVAGGEDKRISNIGRENVSPDWSQDGKLVWSSKRGARYDLVVFDPKQGREIQLTSDGYDYEDPSWAPDGRHIVCSRTGGYHSEVYLLDTLGDPPIRLTTINGEWYSPAWSPK